MAGLPAVLHVAGRRCLVVGGGSVALRRAAALRDAAANVVVVAPQVEPDFDDLGVQVVRRPYQRGDLTGAFLVVIATDEPAVNETIACDARTAGVLINRADDPAAGDFSVPAHQRHGPVTIAVDTQGISATAAAAIRRQLSDALDPDWPRLLETVRPFRQLIQERCADQGQRLTRLAELTGPAAMRTLKQSGQAALRQFCESLADPARSAPQP